MASKYQLISDVYEEAVRGIASNKENWMKFLNTANALGYAVSDIAEMGLSEIAKTVRSLDRTNRTFDKEPEGEYNREKEDGRRYDHEYNVYRAGRISDTGYQDAAGGRSELGGLGDEKKKISEGTQEGRVLQSADIVQSEQTSVGNRESSEGNDERSDRKTSKPGGDNLQLEFYDRRTEDKSLPFFNSDKIWVFVHSVLSDEQLKAIEDIYSHEVTEKKRIFSIDDKTVMLYDETCPLINKNFERDEFARRVRETPGNEHLISKMDDRQAESETVELAETEDKIPAEIEADILPAWEQNTKPSKPVVFTGDRKNFRISDELNASGSKRERFKDNIRAIKLLKRLDEEGRYADPDEQLVLSKYAGWRGIPEVFEKDNGGWSDEYLQLKETLTDEEYSSARESTLTAFYTPSTVIDGMYKALEQMGFKQGNILEPACGIGNFMGRLPASMQKSSIYGVELDAISAGITKHLYQKYSITTEGFERLLHKIFFKSELHFRKSMNSTKI